MMDTKGSAVVLKDVDGQLIAIDHEHLGKPLSQLKNQIAMHFNIAGEDLMLQYGTGYLPDDERSLLDLNVSGTVTALVRIAGGKVHGSLSRAGKVRGQTPKVDKTEKKKKLTGRARRREQYKKRFKTTQVEPRRGRR